MSSDLQTYRPGQTGNVLFLILIAVVLFGALSFAISQTMRTNASNPDRERSEIDAGAIVQFGSSMESAITRIRLSNNCSDTQISFENSLVAGYTNPSAPPSKACNMFDPAGGNMQLLRLVPTQLEPSFSAHSLYGQPFFNGGIGFYSIGTQPTGAALAPGVELAMFVPFLNRSVCIAINQHLGIGTATTEPPWANNPTNRIGAALFTGTYAYTDQITEPLFDNHNAVCLKINSFTGGGGAAPNAYVYAHVLIPR